jgi:putative ATP-binding cassette transporter
MDEVLDAFDADARRLISAILVEDLARTGIIHIGRAEADDRLFSRVLHLIRDPALRRLAQAPQPALSA